MGSFLWEVAVSRHHLGFCPPSEVPETRLALVRRAVDRDGGAGVGGLGDGADDGPVVGQVETGGKAATRAWSSPPVRTKPSGSAPVAAATACRGSSTVNASLRRSIRHPARGRHVADVGEQAVGDVDHRGGAQAQRLGTGGVGHLGPAVRLDQRPRRPEPATEHGQSPGRPPEPPAHGDDVARSRARPAYRRAGGGAERGHRDHQGVAAGEVPADQRGADRRRTPPRCRRTARAPRRRRGRRGPRGPTVTAEARPPIALTSDRLCAAARWPMSEADAQSRRKWRPSTSTSVHSSTSGPGTVRTAASSPGPTTTSSPCGSRRARRSRRPNSPTSASVAPGARGSGGVLGGMVMHSIRRPSRQGNRPVPARPGTR